MKRYLSSLLMLMVFGACESDEKEGPDASVLPDGGADSEGIAECEATQQTLQRFVGEHRDCASDGDCTLVGTCSATAGFAAVSTSARAEAQRLADAVRCESVDGPLFAPVCEQGSCVARPTGGSCGGRASVCQSTHALYQTTCTDAGSPEAACYETCSGPTDDRCQSGFSCQATQVTPVTGGCSAPQIDAFLCRPAAGCEVALSVEITAAPDTRSLKSYALFAGSQETVSLGLWAENLTAAPKTFRYGPRCVGHHLTGLGSYDAFSACLAGACPEDQEPKEITLAPGERALLGTGTVRGAADDCNPSGLARGSYDVGFMLEQLDGATACGPEPVQLRVN